MQATSKDFASLPPVDYTQGGCVLSCSQFEKCAGRELSKKWKERCAAGPWLSATCMSGTLVLPFAACTCPCYCPPKSRLQLPSVLLHR